VDQPDSGQPEIDPLGSGLVDSKASYHLPEIENHLTVEYHFENHSLYKPPLRLTVLYIIPIYEAESALVTEANAHFMGIIPSKSQRLVKTEVQPNEVAVD
jgi:hypothetical protein